MTTFSKYGISNGSSTGYNPRPTDKCLFLRSDGVLVMPYVSYKTADGNYSFSVSYSFDKGETWVNSFRDIPADTIDQNSLELSVLLNNGVVNYLNNTSDFPTATYNCTHNKIEPCVDGYTNIEDWRYDAGGSTNEFGGDLRNVLVDENNILHLMVSGNSPTDPDTRSNRYWKYENEEWTWEQQTGSTSRGPAQGWAIDNSGLLHASYQRNTGSSVVLLYTNYTNGVFNANEVTIDDIGHSSFTTLSNIQLTLDASGYVHILYKTQPVVGGPGVVWYVTNDGGSWVSPIALYQSATAPIPASFSVGSFFISADRNNDIHVSSKMYGYSATHETILYQKRSGGVWGSVEYILETTSTGFAPYTMQGIGYSSNSDNMPISGACGIYYRPAGGFNLAFWKTDDYVPAVEPSATPSWCVAEDVIAEGVCISKVGYVSGGLSHLEGETVSILADGEVLPQQTVVGGAITLDESYANVKVGLPYNADLETLNVDFMMNDGTLMAKNVKIGNVLFGLKDSRGGYIGQDFDDLYEAFTDDNLEKYLGGDSLSATDLMTGETRMPLGADYRPGARICVRQSDPRPITITDITPEIQIGGAAR